MKFIWILLVYFTATNIVIWRKNKTIIFQDKTRLMNDDRYTYNPNDRSITITNVHESDASDYYCQVLPGQSNLTIHLEISGGILPAYILTEDNRNVSERAMTWNEGERIELICRGNSNEKPIKWYTEDGMVKTNDNIEVTDGKLVIKQANRKNAGLYQCIIGESKEKVGHTSVTINISCKNQF